MPLKFHLFILFVLSITLSACERNNVWPVQNANADDLENNNITTALSDNRTVADADRVKGRTVADRVKGGFSVVVLGSGGPAAMPVGKASSGYLIMIDGKPRILLDAGGGTYQRLAKSGINIKDIEIVLMTHLHIDHTSDLPAMIKTVFFHARGAGMLRTDPIKIFGPGSAIAPYPTSAEFIDGFYGANSGVYRYLNGFPGAIKAGELNYTATDLPFDPTDPTMTEVYNDGEADGLRIKSIGVRHGPVPAVAYRIMYGGKSIVYSGDTNSMGGDNMIKISRDTDLLFYATAIMDTVPDCDPVTGTPAFCALHTKPIRMGEVAAAANPKKLILTHLTGFTLPNLHEVKKVVRNQGYRGKIKVASDLKVYNLMDK